MAAVEYCLRIDGIAGDSQDEKHKREIQLESFSWGLAHAEASGGPAGGGGAGKAVVQDLDFVQRTSVASPRLIEAVATGKHVKTATLTARKVGGGQQEFLTIKLDDVVVSSYEISERGAEYPLESVRLRFDTVHVTYKPQKPDGSLGAPVTFGWSVKQNKTV